MKMRFRKIMAAILSTAMVAAAIPAAGILNVQAKSPQEYNIKGIYGMNGSGKSGILLIYSSIFFIIASSD